MLDRHPRPLLDRVAPGDGGVVRGSGGEDHDAAQHLQVGVVHAEALELEPAVAHTVADRLGDGVRLLVDLLQHERLEPALFGALVVPVELDQLAFDSAAVLGPHETDALGRDRDEIAVLGEVHLPRLTEERRGVRGEEGLSLADADDERALQPRADEETGMVAVDDDERKMAFELVEREPCRLDEIAVVVLLDQVGDRLGIGLGGEDVPALAEALTQLAVVLDDPVEDDRELGRVVAGERVRVRLGDAAVGRPARMPESRRSRGSVLTGGALQVLEVADGARVAQPAVLEERDPRRVVAAVFESFETEEEEVLALPRPHISDDPTHWRSSFVVTACRRRWD